MKNLTGETTGITYEDYLAIMKSLPTPIREFLEERAVIPYSVVNIQRAVLVLGTAKTLELLHAINNENQRIKYGPGIPTKER